MKRVPIIVANLSGVVAFAFPFLVGAAQVPGESVARAEDAPWFLALLAPVLIASALTQVDRPASAKSLALLGTLAACAAVLRIPFSFAGANFFFFLPLVGGFVFGTGFGFLLGSLGMAASAVITGGIGPWLPFQMWAAGWLAGGAGMLGKVLPQENHNLRVGALALFGYLAAYFYGALTTLYFWPVLASAEASVGWAPGLGVAGTLDHFRRFYLLTSVAWDSVGGAMNLILILTLGKPTLRILDRYRRLLGFDYHPAAAPAAGEPLLRASL